MKMPSSDNPWGERVLAQLLGSQARAKVLTCLLAGPPEPLHIREVERRCGLPYTAVGRQLGRRGDHGQQRGGPVGSARVYSLVLQSPILAPLRDLIRRTTGLALPLREALAGLPVTVALIYGSVASGQDHADSDVDLLVVGEVDPVILAERLRGVEQQLGREVTPVVYRLQELREELTKGNPFVGSVLRGPMIYLVGDADALPRTAEQRPVAVTPAPTPLTCCCGSRPR